MDQRFIGNGPIEPRAGSVVGWIRKERSTSPPRTMTTYRPATLSTSTALTTVAAGKKKKKKKSVRQLYHAEQLMEDRNQPKKKYLATQRLRRDLERSAEQSLQLDVNYLKQEIANLETVRDILRANRLAVRINSAANLMRTAADYFAMMKWGLGAETPASRYTMAQKVDILRSLFHEQVEYGTGRGVDGFIAQCHAYTIFHSYFMQEDPVLEQLESNEQYALVVVMRNRLRVRFSRKTIEVMFPHLLLDEVMVQDLLGCEIRYPCEIRVYFDERGKIIRHDAMVDFVTGLAVAMDNLRKVTTIMDRARIEGSVILYDDPINSNPRIEEVTEPEPDNVQLDQSELMPEKPLKEHVMVDTACEGADNHTSPASPVDVSENARSIGSPPPGRMRMDFLLS